MRFLDPPQVAPCFEQARTAPSISNWDDLEGLCKRQQRELLIVNQVNHQVSICAWCQSEITIDNSHADHIKPRSRFPQLTFEATNIVASCQKNTHCGHFRRNSEDLPSSIHPYENSAIESHFEYLPNGAIQASAELSPNLKEEAQQAINHLNLDCRQLREKRETLLAELNNMAQGCEELARETLLSLIPSFPSMCEQNLK